MNNWHRILNGIVTLVRMERLINAAVFINLSSTFKARICQSVLLLMAFDFFFLYFSPVVNIHKCVPGKGPSFFFFLNSISFLHGSILSSTDSFAVVSALQSYLFFPLFPIN